MKQLKLYEVGGTLRDEILGIPSKDRDFAVEAPDWETMLEWAQQAMDKIWVTHPEFVTIRGMYQGIAADFTLCRKEGGYSDHRHPDSVEPGTILEDLSRRDFTCNAIARDFHTKEVLDPHDGTRDINRQLLRCVGDPQDRFEEDPLRILRAVRFCVTKDFAPSTDILNILQYPHWGPTDWIELLASVSVERVREELYRCLKHNTYATIDFLTDMHDDYRSLFFINWGIWLEPTLKDK